MRIFIFTIIVFLPCAFLLCFGEVCDSIITYHLAPVRLIPVMELSANKDTVKVYTGDTIYIYKQVDKLLKEEEK